VDGIPVVLSVWCSQEVMPAVTRIDLRIVNWFEDVAFVGQSSC
jgi:hypothetical protein